MLDWNQHLFLLLNAPAHPAGWLVGSVVALADSPVMVTPLLLIALWIWGVSSRRGALLAVAVALLVGQGINQVLGHLWFEPRPFMIPVGHTLTTHAADNGFPSDHATLVWALGAASPARDVQRPIPGHYRSWSGSTRTRCHCCTCPQP